MTVVWLLGGLCAALGALGGALFLGWWVAIGWWK